MVFIISTSLCRSLEARFESVRPVTLSKIRLRNYLLRVPLLLDLFVFNMPLIDCLRIARVAELEMGRFHFFDNDHTGVFGHVLTNFISLLSRLLGLVILEFITVSGDLTVST